MGHLLVTNDFPPKQGGIQSYLHELWRRLPPSETTVYTTRFGGAAAFDAAQDFRVVRAGGSVLLPTPATVAAIRSLAAEVGAGLVLLDPALPIGLVGPQLGIPYGVVLHGAEVTVPGRLPVSRQLLARTLSRASLVVAAGGYPAEEGRRAAGGRLPRVVVIPPGVDAGRFRPLAPVEREAARAHLRLDPDSLVVSSISRLVPRKGMDVLIKAVGLLKARRAASDPDLVLAIGGEGRDRRRLETVAGAAGVPVHWFGRLPDDDLPLAYGASDLYAMCCRDRWMGLEQEGFGIVFLEAAACGVPQVAGLSGGSAEAVVDGATGIVVDRPGDERAVAAALDELLRDEALRRQYGEAARMRAEAQFDYDALAGRLREAISDAGG